MSSQGLLAAVELAVKRVRQDVAGSIALKEWLGDGANPVPQELADQRANTCAHCPQNVRRKRVENVVAETIRRHEEARSRILLRTPNDANLNTCVTCGCYLKLKVWVPIEHQTDPGFPGNCWVKRELEEKPKANEPRPPAAPAVLKHAPASREVISIRRTDAYGDVIMASIVASRLHEMGREVHFWASEFARRPLFNHPHIHRIMDSGEGCDIVLDDSYERHVDRRKKDRMLLMLESASAQLKAPLDMANRVPTLRVTDEETTSASEFLSKFQRPWTFVIPQSACWPNRGVNPNELSVVARVLPGTVFWAYPTPPPDGFTHFKTPDFRGLMAGISLCDLVITPDTGPLHVATSFRKKVVCLETCNDPSLVITNLTDYSSVSAQLECIGCGHFQCPIDVNSPPCRMIPSSLILPEAMKKLSALRNRKVSVIIPVLNFHERLRRCIEAVAPQVDEILIAIDGSATVPFLDPKVKVVENPWGNRSGYGKTCMRAARHAIGEYLLMLNDDCYLNPGAVAAMVDEMRDHVAVVGAQLWYPDGTIQHGGTSRNRGDIGFGHIDHRSKKPSITAPTRMECVTFAAALVRRSAFFDVLGFDERYDCYSEDSDFCMKVRQAGWHVVYQPHAKGIHDESQSTSPTKERMLLEAHRIFRSKWERHFNHNPPPIR